MNIKNQNLNKLITIKYSLLNYYKLVLLIFFFFSIIYYCKTMKFYILEINNNYLKIQKDLNINISLVKNLKNKIKLGLFSYGLKNGGRARLTSILINYFYSIKIFNIYLFTKVDKNSNEYLIPEDIKRMTIKDNVKKLIKNISKNKIDILIYNLDNYKEVNYLNNRKTPKIIYYQHSSFFFLLYSNYTSFLSLYKEYQNSKYFVYLLEFKLNKNYI